MVQPISPLFQWKDGQLKSPAEVAREQRVAEALMFAKPQATGFWGALGQIGSAASGSLLDSRADASEQQGREAASALFGSLGSDTSTDAIAQALMNPAAAWATPAQSGVAEALLNSGLKQQDPMYQLQLQQAQLELEQMRNPGPAGLINAGNGNIYDPNTGQWITAPGGMGAGMTDTQQNLMWRAEQAGLQPGTPEYQQFMMSGGSGGTSLSVDPATGAVSFTQGFAGKPMTEGQSKDTVYSTRARGVLPTINTLENELLSLGDNLAGNVPVLGNYMQSEGYQKANNAGREFVAAILRKDTGAAVTPSEEALYGDVYLPRPGDKPGTIVQKRLARERALAAMEAGMPPQAILAQEQALQSIGQTSGAEPAQSTTTPPGITIRRID